MPDIIPKPVFEKSESGSFNLSPQAKITVDPGIDEIISIGQYLAEKLRPATGYTLPVLPSANEPNQGNIALSLKAGNRGLGEEGYELEVAVNGIRLSAFHPAGLFRGIQSIRQLLPPAIESSRIQNRSWVIPAVILRDQPRFSWRGAMLDVARHFFTPDDVKKYIDWLALYKINVFHLHLTDDQGWRIMICQWPRLAEVGGSTQVGGGPAGYYTQEEYADIVAYAKERYVSLVPEIDAPGHTQAAMAAYPELTCDGVAPGLFTEPKAGFSALCAGKPLAYRFLDDVIGELAAITPGLYIHIGGDESTISVSNPEEYNAFIEKTKTIIQRHGKKFIGWDETAMAHLGDDAIVQHWIVNSPQNQLARKAVDQGAKIIMSPGNRAYLDMKYDPSTPLGQTWAGYNDVQHAYEWDPATEEEGVTESNVLGVEAPLWTETVANLADAGTMTFPRLPGIAEIGWSSVSNRTWNEYRFRLAAQAPRWKAMGLNYYPSPQVEWKD